MTTLDPQKCDHYICADCTKATATENHSVLLSATSASMVGPRKSPKQDQPQRGKTRQLLFSLVAPVRTYGFGSASWLGANGVTVMKVAEMEFAFDDEGYWRFRFVYNCFAEYLSYVYTFTMLSKKTERALGRLGEYNFGGYLLPGGSFIPRNAPAICHPGEVCQRGGPNVLYGQVTRGAGTIEKEGMAPLLRYDFDRIGTISYVSHGYYEW